MLGTETSYIRGDFFVLSSCNVFASNLNISCKMTIIYTKKEFFFLFLLWHHDAGGEWIWD